MPASSPRRADGRYTCQGAGGGEFGGSNVTHIADAHEPSRRHAWPRRWGDVSLPSLAYLGSWTLGIVAGEMGLGWPIVREPWAKSTRVPYTGRMESLNP